MAATSDIITLENFASKMPRWDYDLPNHLYALVDMGSNGIRFSISDLSLPQTRLLRCIYRERAAISLFDALNSSSSDESLIFQSDIISEVSKTLAKFKSIANEFGVPAEHISIFATEAMRKAENAVSMLDAILAASGLGVHVLAPEVETLFGAMGARSGFGEVNGLFLDLGGGSVQMTYLNSSVEGYELAAAQAGKSLPFGAAKLTKVLERADTEAQVTAASTLREGMRGAFAKLQEQFPSLRDTQTEQGECGVDVYLCGGGFRGYGSILMHTDPIQPYPIPTIGAYAVTGPFFNQTKHMRKVNTECEGKIRGMSKRRRQQFPAIATVVEALIDAIPRIRTVTFCSGGNREGALYMMLPKDLREKNPLPCLRQLNDRVELETLESVIALMESCLPANFDFSFIPTVFTLGLGRLFAGDIWTRVGGSSDANAAFELHNAIHRDPDTPGFTHLARAILGITLYFRWGGSLGPSDGQLLSNLQKVISRSNPKANFWAEYLGAVANLLTVVFPVRPDTPDKLKNAIKFRSSIKAGESKTKVQLVVSLSLIASHAPQTQDLVSCFKNVGKHRNTADESETKVELLVQRVEL
ncbi:retrograde regulation protein [Hypoxylon sp. FL0890]|nr:retrograde regulation protein [Hypoxylon sp. FL0890]